MAPPRVPRLPKLPALLGTKLYKTGQTRGADDDEIYQNRVLRYSTVLIPIGHWEACAVPDDGTLAYDCGYIVLIDPPTYFGATAPDAALAVRGLALGRNALVFYETRAQWDQHNPTTLGWVPATSRRDPLGGQYVARISANTAAGGASIRHGFTSTSSKGAGVRVYEYASYTNIAACRTQLEALFWLCNDSTNAMITAGMTAGDVAVRRAHALTTATEAGLLDMGRLTATRVVTATGVTQCPLCLDPIPASAFLSRLVQAAGRETLDQTVTEVSLFHIQELRVGILHHKPYNLGWGHHHCNVVTKDSGIVETLRWMRVVVNRNEDAGVI